jgi:hypothetical protein
VVDRRNQLTNRRRPHGQYDASVPILIEVKRARAAAFLLALVGLIAACSDDDDPPVPPPDASTYAAAVSHFLPAVQEGEQPNVFVASLDEPLALDEQVAVIDALGDGYDVKFVDDDDAAIDENAEGRPPRDDGLLIGIGTLPIEPPFVVRVEVYRSEVDIEATMVTMAWRTDHWDVATEEPVDAEGFVPDE